MNNTEFDKLFKPLANTKPMAVSGSCRKALKKTIFKTNFWSFNLYNFNILYSILIVGIISTTSVIVINKINPNNKEQITILPENNKEIQENNIDLDSTELQINDFTEETNEVNNTIEEEINRVENSQDTQTQIEYIYITDSVVIEEHHTIYDTIK